MKPGPEKVKRVLRALQTLGADRVKVGVPGRTANRKGPLNNATLLYIHENGAPEANIPARKPLQTGLQDAKPLLAQRFRTLGKKALQFDGDPETVVHQGLEGVGLVAAAAVKRAITGGLSPPLSDRTLRRRDRRLLRKQGRTAEVTAKLAGRKPLLDTGALKNAITYVVTRD